MEILFCSFDVWRKKGVDNQRTIEVTTIFTVQLKGRTGYCAYTIHHYPPTTMNKETHTSLKSNRGVGEVVVFVLHWILEV